LGPEKLELRDVEVPRISKGQALVKVASNGICGSDITIFRGHHPRAAPPLIMGHEILGEIKEISGNGRKLKIGDTVAVRPIVSCGKCNACKSGYPHVCRELRLPGVDFDGGCAEYVRVPVSLLHKVPENASTEDVALTEPLAVAVHALNRIKPLTREMEILVFGAGPIGALISLLLQRRGFRKFQVADVSLFRLARLKEFGVKTLDVSNPEFLIMCKQLTRGEGFDVILEATGSRDAALRMTELSGVRGRILALGVHKTAPTVDLTQVAFKELQIVGTRVYTDDDFEHALRLAATGELKLARLVTHRFGIGDGQRGFEAMEDKNSSIKVLIEPNL
jgi:2-desacetyl-2-hydroxyethyl bacteriochlorophyllide A dehydrogenase